MALIDALFSPSTAPVDTAPVEQALDSASDRITSILNQRTAPPQISDVARAISQAVSPNVGFYDAMDNIQAQRTQQAMGDLDLTFKQIEILQAKNQLKADQGDPFSKARGQIFEIIKELPGEAVPQVFRELSTRPMPGTPEQAFADFADIVGGIVPAESLPAGMERKSDGTVGWIPGYMESKTAEHWATTTPVETWSQVEIDGQPMLRSSRGDIKAMPGQGGQGITIYDPNTGQPLAQVGGSGKMTEAQGTGSFRGQMLAQALQGLASVDFNNVSAAKMAGTEMASGSAMGRFAGQSILNDDEKRFIGAQAQATEAITAATTGAAYTDEQRTAYRDAYVPAATDSPARKQEKINNIRWLLTQLDVIAGGSRIPLPPGYQAPQETTAPVDDEELPPGFELVQ